VVKRNVQKAMWSVHFHRYALRDARPVPSDVWDSVKPIALEEARRILWADATREFKAARAADENAVTPASLLALMRLYTARELHPDIFEDPGTEDLFRVQKEAVQRLYGMDSSMAPGSPPVVEPLTPPTYNDPVEIPSDSLTTPPSVDPAFGLQESPVWSGVFPVRKRVLDITYHAATGWLSVVWSIDVQRPFAGMLKSLDPRNWDYCSAYVEVAAETGKDQLPPPVDPGGPGNAGSSWANYFWERLGTGFGGQQDVMVNQLYVTFNVSPQMTGTTFSDTDPSHVKTKVDPNLIEFDRGWVVAGVVPADPSWTRIRGVKHLKFNQSWLPGVAVPLLASWGTEEMNTGVACLVP
jgi:hypothetical protein